MNLQNNEFSFIESIKAKVRIAQYEAFKAVNVQLIALYWELGKAISEKQSEGWGKAIVPTLAKELQMEFPKMSGFSVGNLWLMSQFYNEYNLNENLVPLVR
jgi:predicted nuclease of restriction endonuclease-like (RecB) superfamily